jgi:hypothetical protein
LQEKINEKSNASAFPYQCKKQHKERTPRLQIRYARNQINSSKRSGRWPKPPGMSVMALDREDVSWVHNHYSSLKLIYHKNDIKRMIRLLSALWEEG